jgi:2-dehydro-3-deoxyphosphogalactonate aldolase
MTNAPLHALFSVRTRDLFSGGGEARTRACIANRGWLSGALLALELREASKWLSTSFSSLLKVSIIGTGPLAERYARAMTLMGIAQPTVSAPHAAAKGLIIIGEILGILPSRNPSSISTSSLPPTSLTNNNELIHQQRLNLLTNSLRLVPIIAILRGLDPTNAVAVGISLYEAGIRIIEVPLNSPIRPLESIRSLIAAFEHLPKEERPIVGAGTVLSVEDVKNVASIGGQVALAPNTDTDVIRAARAAGLPFFPGIATASEALSAVKAGASGLKLFPCTSISLSTVEALKAILPNKIPLLAVGGVGASNGLSYLSAGCIGLGIGSAIFDPTVSPKEVQTNAVKLVKALGRNAN